MVEKEIYFVKKTRYGIPTGTISMPSVLSAPTAPTAGTPTAGGSVTAGTHSYKVTFVTAVGETTPSVKSSVITAVSTSGQTVPLTDIPVGPVGTVSRKIYRTATGDTGDWKLLATIADNTTTTYSDTTADASLGVSAPTANTTTGLIELGENVKGQIKLSESDPSITKIRTEQGNTPRRIVAAEPGEVDITLQYHDMSYDVLAALKGGTSVAAVAGVSAAAWKPGLTFETHSLAFQVETESGQYYNFYNALIVATVGGAGTRDGFFYVQVKVYPQMTADKAGDWEIRDIAIPAA